TKPTPMTVAAAIQIRADRRARRREKGGGDAAGGCRCTRLPVNNDANLVADLRIWLRNGPRRWARAHGRPNDSEDRVMTARTSFRGSFTALVTPFGNGALDEKAFRGLVDWQIAGGTNGLVPVGPTRQSPTLSPQGHGREGQGCG